MSCSVEGPNVYDVNSGQSALNADMKSLTYKRLRCGSTVTRGGGLQCLIIVISKLMIYGPRVLGSRTCMITFKYKEEPQNFVKLIKPMPFEQWLAPRTRITEWV